MVNKLVILFSKIPNKWVFRINVFALCLMIIVSMINDKWPFKGAQFVLANIPLIWLGGTFPFITGVAKVYISKDEMNKKLAITVMILGAFMIIVTFIGPPILYYLQLQNLQEMERLKELIKHSS